MSETEMKPTQDEEAARNQKMERLIVAGEVALALMHELRNKLNIIRGSLYYVRTKLAEPINADEKLKKHMERADKDIQSMVYLMEKSLRFAKDKALEMQPFDLSQLVEESLLFLTGNTMVDLVRDYRGDTFIISCDTEQLRLVFTNLIINAVQAMEGKGQLTVTMLKREPGEVTVAFTDIGKGISPENRAKLFTSFFTTKTAGTGLGLAMCQRITKLHNGRIEVESEMGKGTTFTVILPSRPTGSPA